MSVICIPVGWQTAGINLFIKALKEALNLQEGTRFTDKGVNNTWREKALDSLQVIDKVLDVEGGVEEQLSFPSISSILFDQDIAMASRADRFTEKGFSSDPEEVEDSMEEEKKAQTLFQPAFEVYFESIFKAVESQILEALAKKVLLDKLKSGLLQNMSGKTLRATRETVKSMEKVSLIHFEGSKHPIFFSSSKADEKMVIDFLTGEEAEESQITKV
ncbi:hypothetical protein DM860_001184 [Cuscuta australis]|uniref:Uncharacterized protein n=1 Tax=Cuscuta australis TaxID=267555 RepID=A0A328DT90_9ASTE|nr:hypothetical protein DM860_001184 [Cuscuta australis]